MGGPVYSHEWLVSGFAKRKERIESPRFKLGPARQTWSMSLYPPQCRAPRTHLSAFLRAVDLANPLSVKFKIIVHNWTDPSSNCIAQAMKPTAVAAQYEFYDEEHGRGFPKLIPRDQLTAASGFLRHDGALLLRVEVEFPDKSSGDERCDEDNDDGMYPATLKDSAAAPSDVTTDLLALWERPGVTSDLTIIATAAGAAATGAVAGGGSSSPAAGGGSGGGVGGAGGSGGSPPQGGGPAQNTRSRMAKTPSGAPGGLAASSSAAATGAAGASGSSSGRFDVHRAILAARCPFFATLFESGMGDSSARELPLPDTDPDALRPLPRFLYGGALTITSRGQARSCLALADRLLLPKAAALLRTHLLSTLSGSRAVGDLLWAADAGQGEMLTTLVEYCADAAEDVPEESVRQLAATHPALMAQLYTAGRRAAKRLRT